MPNELATIQENALSGVGRAFAQTGDITQALAEKQAMAKNDADVMEAMTSLEEEAGKIEEWKLQNMGNPSSWAKEWHDRSTSALGGITSQEGLSDYAKRTIKRDGMQFNSKQGTRVAIGAASQEFARAKSSILSMIDTATESGDEAAMEMAVQVGLEKGYFYEADATNARQRFEKVQKHNAEEAEAEALELNAHAFAAELMGAPHEAVSKLKDTRKDGTNRHYEWADPEQLQLMSRKAIAAQRHHDADSTNMVLQGIVRGDGKGLTEKQIRDKGAEFGWEPTEIQKMIDFRKDWTQRQIDEGPVSSERRQSIIHAVETYDGNGDDQMAEWHALWGAIETEAAGGGDHGAAMRGVLHRKLSNKQPYGRRMEPPGKQNYSSELHEIMDLRQEKGQFLEDPSTMLDKDGKRTGTTEFELSLMADLQREFTKELEKGTIQGREAVTNWLNMMVPKAKKHINQFRPTSIGQNSTQSNSPIPTEEEIQKARDIIR